MEQNASLQTLKYIFNNPWLTDYILKIIIPLIAVGFQRGDCDIGEPEIRH